MQKKSAASVALGESNGAKSIYFGYLFAAHTEREWKQTGQEKEKRSRIKKVSYSVRHYCKVDSLTAATHGGEDRSVAPPLPTPPLPIKLHTTTDMSGVAAPW